MRTCDSDRERDVSTIATHNCVTTARTHAAHATRRLPKSGELPTVTHVTPKSTPIRRVTYVYVCYVQVYPNLESEIISSVTYGYARYVQVYPNLQSAMISSSNHI